MKITRIGSERQLQKETKVIDIKLDGRGFVGYDLEIRITEDHGNLRIHKKNGETLIINPACDNECLIS